jgi:hypothetical protein
LHISVTSALLQAALFHLVVQMLVANRLLQRRELEVLYIIATLQKAWLY